MEYIGVESNKCNTRKVYKYWCAKGHNNQYAFKKTPPPARYYILGNGFYSKEEAYIFCSQLFDYSHTRPRVFDSILNRLIKYEDLLL